MAEVVLSVAAKLAEYLVDPTLHQLQYLFCDGKITRNFETRKEELIFKQGRVQERVQEAINRTERIDDEVNKWRNDVESIIAEVENLQQERRANNSCFRGWCPTWRRYYHCKKLAKTTLRIIELNTKSGQFCPFSHPVIVPDIEYHSSRDFVFFKSTKMASDKLWEALHNDGCLIIGLWGMGGSGKTTLVKEVGKKVKESKLFDRVVITTISQTPNIRKIQGEIADLLGLELKEETEAGRARRIAMRLQSSNERILIILDDVWAKLNLEDIGNPLEEKGARNCKVLLTTRRQEVCTLMDCQNTIPLNLLTEDEAWILFQTHANVDNGAKEVVAREVAKECKGLPIAIVAVGMCLKGKGVDEMKVVLDKLKHSKPINVDEGVRDAFACLELSFNYLRPTKAKLLLLMCAIFPEDHKIVIEDLFRNGVGLGLCEDADSFEIARSQVVAAINVLVDSSLLMYSLNFRSEKCVMMHDMVRDVTLWIASKEHRTIMVNLEKELNELLEDKVVKDCYAISSGYMDEMICQFPSQLDAPKLEILLLHSPFPSQFDAPKLDEILFLHSQKPLDLSNSSFEGIKGLKVVAMISKGKASSLLWMHHSQSIEWFSNLRTLRLQGRDLGDISFVVSLTSLEILDLQTSRFKKLPNGIEKLNKLKLLDLSSCTTDECCYKLIGRCLQLEELHAPGSFNHWEETNCSEWLVGIPAFVKLMRYELHIGHCYRTGTLKECTRVLYLGQLNISVSSALIKDLIQRSIAIEFSGLLGGCKSFIPHMVQVVGGMNELTQLYLLLCSEIECLIDTTAPYEDIVVPTLEELELREMNNLKQLCRGPSLLCFFQNLQHLEIWNCPQLLNLFPIDGNLQNLNFLQIYGCPMLTCLFPNTIACTLLSLEQLRIEACHKLKHLIEGGADADAGACEDLRFPKWEILYIRSCYQLESVCPMFCVQGFVQLKCLFIENAHHLKFVFGGHVNEETSTYDQNETRIVLPLLEELRLENLPNLLRICSISYHLRLPSIKKVHWRNCPRLNASCDPLIIGSKLQQPHPNMELHVLNGHQLRNEESRSMEVVSNIESIHLENCGVVSVFHYHTGVEVKKDTASNDLNLFLQIPILQHLKKLYVINFAKLKSFFSTSICQSLLELTSVTISSCEDLEEIFSGNEETQKNPCTAQACLPKLQSLVINQCNKLKVIFSIKTSFAISMLPKLTTLSISNSSQLEEIFRCSNVEDHGIGSENEIILPNLKHITLEKLPRLVNVCPGSKLYRVKFCKVLIRECPKVVPIVGASTDWIEGRLVRKYVSKCSQLSNNESLSLPLSILNSEEFDIESFRVQDLFRVIGETDNDDYDVDVDDDDDEQLKDSGMLSSKHQILRGLSPTQVLNFQYLHSLEVIRCEKLKFLFSVSTIVYNSLPKLTSLTLSNCEELEEIIADNGEPQDISNVQVCFPELRNLKIRWCNKLKRLFSTTTATILPQLHSLLITEANQLEVIFGHRREDDSNNGEKIVLPNLRKLQLKTLPNFISVCQGTQLQAVQLTNIYICQCPKFLDPILGSTQMVSLQQSGTMFPQVSIEVPDYQIAANVIKQMPVNEEKGMIMISRVEKLALKHSANLMIVWEGPTLISFQNLCDLKVFGCRNLKSIFSGTVIRSLPRLKQLRIRGCEELEEIFSKRLQEQVHHFPNPSSNSLCFPQLDTLLVNRCNKLKCLFSNPSIGEFPELEYLEIKGCSQLEQVFGCEIEIHEEGLNQNVLPKLKCLILQRLPNFTGICGGFPFQLKFQSLRNFKVKDCPIFSKNTLATLSSLPTHYDQESGPESEDYVPFTDPDDHDAYVKKLSTKEFLEWHDDDKWQRRLHLP